MVNRGYIRFLYNQNPFYLISACCVLYGIQSNLKHHSDPNSLWLLSAILVGYAMLMAMTAILIVKFGKVWDDARSIMMVILLMFFSISISFDELCVDQPQVATIMLVAGFLLSLTTTEFVLRALQIKLPPWFRIPYYLILLIIFLFPLLFSFKQYWFPESSNHWVMLLFPTVSAFAILTLVPAIRRGRSYTRKNGTPWPWPLYPWCIFFMLSIGICIRCFVLCVAFEPKTGLHSAFGTYMLVPILIACSIILLELAAVENFRALKKYAFGLSLMCFPLGCTWHSNQAYDECLGLLTGFVGSPVWLIGVLVTGYFLLAYVRQLDTHGIGLTLAACLSVGTTGQANVLFSGPLSLWPLAFLTMFHVTMGLKHNKTHQLFMASLFFCALVSLTTMKILSPSIALATGFQVLLFSWMLIGTLWKDKFSNQLNAVAALGLAVYAIAVFLTGVTNFEFASLCSADLALIVTVSYASYRWQRDRLVRYAGWASACLLSLLLIRLTANYWSTPTTQNLTNYLMVGAAFFAVGLFISLLKGGMSKSAYTLWNEGWSDLFSRFQTPKKTPSDTTLA